MEVVKRLAIEHRQSFINEAKRLCGLSIAQSGEAQDGRVSLPARKLDLRTSLIPTQYGEKIVLRLLDLSREFNLDRSGLAVAAIAELRDALRAKNGVVIVSGPTGSGKTTLLYTLLCALDRVGKNVITLEDPIEYSIAGLTQVQVTPKLSFAKALRSILRQDPDVILVGEIRDSETADLCVKAASTGHLVLSTLHANSAAEVVTRLLNLGVDRYMLKSCLRFSAAQRLVKKLCPRCSTAAPASVRTALNELCLQRKFRVSKEADLRVRSAAGCSECRQGVVGRIPILEYLKAAQVSAYLADTPGSDAPAHLTLREAALRHVEKGVTDVSEILELE
jgi:type II secretory ATPase GspE/PulE/Tfp pilus assembly ATPase PilB-like protein